MEVLDGFINTLNQTKSARVDLLTSIFSGLGGYEKLVHTLENVKLYSRTKAVVLKVLLLQMDLTPEAGMDQLNMNFKELDLTDPKFTTFTQYVAMLMRGMQRTISRLSRCLEGFTAIMKW